MSAKSFTLGQFILWSLFMATPPPIPGQNPPAASHGPTIDGETFVARSIPDRQQGGILVGVLSIPEKWKFDSQVVWNYGRINSPVTISAEATNPANGEAFYVFPAVQYFCLRPDVNMFQPGQDMAGYMFSHQPSAPIPALASFVQWARGSQKKFAFVGSKDLPDLPAALRLPASPNQKGVGVRVTYEMNGKPFEEEFYAVYYNNTVPYDGPQGRTFQINWGLHGMHSFRAPAGTLDKRRPVFAAMGKSFRPNPAWKQREAAINNYLSQMFNAQMQAGYNAIAAAGQVSRMISANNDAMLANIDHQLANSRPLPSTSGGRDAADNFDDYIRGVDTVQDPYYGTSQHSYNEKFHWTDGYGTYRNSNDPTYDPNHTEVGNWQLMPAAR